MNFEHRFKAKLLSIYSKLQFFILRFLYDQILENTDRSSEKESNIMSLRKTREKFGQSEVLKISVKGSL